MGLILIVPSWMRAMVVLASITKLGVGALPSCVPPLVLFYCSGRVFFLGWLWLDRFSRLGVCRGRSLASWGHKCADPVHHFTACHILPLPFLATGPCAGYRLPRPSSNLPRRRARCLPPLVRLRAHPHVAQPHVRPHGDLPRHSFPKPSRNPMPPPMPSSA
jgi:hypothetical protein